MRQLRWPIHPKPFNEESLLSWLSRISNCYNCNIQDLLEHDLGFYGNPDDLNISIPTQLLSLLSKRACISEEAIHTMTLSSWAPLLLDDITAKETNFENYVYQYSLLLPTKTRGRHQPTQPWKPLLLHPSKTIRACRICVTNDSNHRIFLAWYLPMMLSCPIHQCMLSECSINQGRYVYWEEKNNFTPSLTPAANKMDKRTWSALTTGYVKLPYRTIHGGVWLRLLRTLLDELHILVSSVKRLYAKNIIDMWTESGFKLRGGKSQWHPYESLPFAIQQQSLMTAAMAIEQIESESINPPGEQIYLFLPEHWLPCPQQTCNSSKIKPKSEWEKSLDAFDKFISIVKQDPVEAKNFKNLLLLGRTDFNATQIIDDLLISTGIPKEFLGP